MYFEKQGPENTEQTLKTAIQEAQKRKIKHLVVASTWGATAQKASELTKQTDIKLIIVTHNYGFSATGKGASKEKEPVGQQFDIKIKEELESAGVKILTGTMVLRNLGCAIRTKFGYSQEELVNSVLRMFGQGTKVCAEMAAMVFDAGLVKTEDIICVAGTGTGADTAWVLQANSSNCFFDIKLKEALAKPKNF